MGTEQNFDSKIRAALKRECDGISATEELKNRIDAELDMRTNPRAAQGISAQRKEGSIFMKRMSIKRLAITVATACLLVSGLTAFAGKTFSITVGGHAQPDYTDYADMGAAQEKLGYAVDSVEQFTNGYSFAGININKLEGHSEEGDTIYSIPQIQISYEKEDKDVVLYVHKRMEERVFSKEPDAARTCGDIDLRYDEYTYKYVPVDYELTEDDKVNEQKDNYFISYGTDEVEIKKCVVVSWEKDGNIYELLGFDLDVSGEGLLDMAEEILR